MGKIKILFFCAVFLILFLNLGFSETILLKSGQKVEGKIIEKTDKYVKLDFFGVDLVYYNDEVASITQGVADSENTVSPQLESLYQAYTSSLNVPQKKNEEKAIETPVLPVVPQAVETSPAASVIAQNSGLSQLPPEYQKMMQAALQGMSGAQGSQLSGSKPAGGMPTGVDISQLPPEYQKMLKTTMANLQAGKSKSPGEKE